jgi:hypothetical protein
MRTVRSDEAVYSTPLPFNPPPPHRTTFTLAVCPPKVYSSRRVAIAHTLTVPSLDEDANRGAEGFLNSDIYIKSAARAESSDRRGLSTNMCTGSQDKDVIHFVCPLSASPIGFPVLGSHIRTFEDEMAAYIRKKYLARQKTHMAVVSPRRQFSFKSLPLDAQNPIFVPGERVRRRFRKQIPQACIGVSRASGKEVPRWGERRAEYWR